MVTTPPVPTGVGASTIEAGPIDPMKEDRFEMNEAFRLTLGEAYSELVSDDDVVWQDPLDSTDQEERSRERGR